jgi:hypothetical protein
MAQQRLRPHAAPTMETRDDRPIGAPILAERRRDRLSIWIAKHRWAVPLIRLAGGVTFLATVALVFDPSWAWDKVAAFVAGAIVGDTVGEHEKERGDRLGAPPDSLPSEFKEYFKVPPATESDGRYLRRRY